MGLSQEMLEALTDIGFEKPSDIQGQAIPHLLTGFNDFIGLAQTGTGKTAAFGIPLLERVEPALPHTQALVLAPTRELGQQIAQQLELFSKYKKRVNVLAVYGGAPISQQIKALKKPQHVIIATPGRLIDLIKRKAVKLHELEYLVLDEADEMLNMGFKEELDTILSFTPMEKLTWLFSATMPQEIKRIVDNYMDDPVEVKIDAKNKVNVNIDHEYVIVRRADKAEALTRFLDLNPDMRGVVFCRTKRETQELADELAKRGYKADALHGDLNQQKRDKVMNRFKAHHLQVLVATDVAARGIDVDDLSHVIHHSLPDDNSYYTHRSGRTARAGKSGTSLAFVSGNEHYKINMLERKLGIAFKRVMIPSSESITTSRIESWCMDILQKKTKGRLDPKIIEKANLLFGNLSREELTAKVLMFELEKLKFGSSRDLNDVPVKKAREQRRKNSRGHQRKYRGGRGRKRRR